MRALPKEKKYSWSPRSLYLQKILQAGITILIINWIFQGVRGMQYKELSFRITLELSAGTIIYFLLFFESTIWYIGVLCSFVIAHTFNWLFNTHLWVCVRYMKIYSRNPDALRKFLETVSIKLNSKSWISEAVCIGSVGDKGDVSSWRSDIDLRLFFKPGLLNYIRLNLYLIYLRTWALVTIIPLDLYAYDDIDFLTRFKKDEGIFLIKDSDGRIMHKYSDRVSSGIK